MTIKVIPITKWHTQIATHPTDSLDIDWPGIHREIGQECMEWCKIQEQQQRLTMVVEKQFSRARLALEFQDPACATEFWLRFRRDG